MENKNMSQAIDKGSEAMQRTAKTMGDTVVEVLDRLAGTKSDLKLTFEDLRLDAQVFNARVNGSIVLDVTMAKNVETTTASSS